MKLSLFDYYLPDELIAQESLTQRDESRLLILNRKDKNLKEIIFKNIGKVLGKGDVLVLNDTRVIPARLFARRKTGGRLETLLLKQERPGIWQVLVKPGKKAHIGDDITFEDNRFSAQIITKTESGGRLIRFNRSNIKELIKNYGRVPLPHYIKKELKQPDRYQTVYAKKEGAIAAPTAGLHFTKELLNQLIASGVKVVYITLHCGLATFRPVKTEDIRKHKMDKEFYKIDMQAAGVINQAKLQGRRVFAVGTTVARALEAAAFSYKKGIYQIRSKDTHTKLYIYPGYKFKIIDAMLTNFHFPRSTNFILISALAGIDFIHKAYQYAIEKRFRFYSFGDAMLVI